ncbi:lipopolysaccharide biosynthesis protein [Nocardioides phosphati]|nr:hypothetical protein [Nocardioides phosphati]
MSTAARGLSLAVPLVMIPLTYRYFGPEQYAVWATVVATTSMFLWADLGLGNGLMTRLSASLARADMAGSRHLISVAYSTLSLLALVLLAGLLVLVHLVSLAPVFGTDHASHVNATVLVCFGLLFINVPLGLIQRIQYAAQEVGRSHLFQMVGPVFALAAASVMIALGAGFLPTVAVIGLGPIVASLAASVSFFALRPELRPVWVWPLGSASRELLRIGGLFLLVQATSSVAMNVDLPIAAHTSSDAELASFSATVRVFLILGAIVSVAVLPMWPANAEALERGDVLWVRRTTRRMSLLSVAVVAAAGLLGAMVGGPVLEFLLGAGFHADRRVMLALTLMWAVVSATSPYLLVQNAAGMLVPQVLAWPVLLIAAVLVKYFVAVHVGLWAIALVGAGVHALVIGPIAVFGCRHVLARDVRAEVRIG